jgi:hypothetical protein
MTYRQLELVLAGPGEIHRPNLIDIPEWHDKDDLMAGATPDDRLPGARRVWASAPRHMRSSASPPLAPRHPLELRHDTILDVREGGIRWPLPAPFEAA